jgi:hypothetical protein
MAVQTRNAAAHLPAEMARLWVETAMVITLRTWALAWGTAAASERSLMADEKQPAFATAALAASSAGMAAALSRDPAGASQAAAGAWTRSLSRKVRANRRRLTRPRRRIAR